MIHLFEESAQATLLPFPKQWRLNIPPIDLRRSPEVTRSFRVRTRRVFSGGKRTARKSGDTRYINLLIFSFPSLIFFNQNTLAQCRNYQKMSLHWSFLSVFLTLAILQVSTVRSTPIDGNLHYLIKTILTESNPNEQVASLNQLREYLNRMCVLGYFGATRAHACQRIVELVHEINPNDDENNLSQIHDQSNNEAHGIQKRFFCNGFIGCKKAGRWLSTDEKRNEHFILRKKTEQRWLAAIWKISFRTKSKIKRNSNAVCSLDFHFFRQLTARESHTSKHRWD